MKVLYIISLIVYFYYIMYKSRKFMHMLQQNWYNDGNRYLKWIRDNFNKVYMNVELLFIFFYFFNKYIFILFILLYVISYTMFNNKVTHEQSKKPLVITPRIKRLYFTMLVL